MRKCGNMRKTTEPSRRVCSLNWVWNTGGTSGNRILNQNVNKRPDFETPERNLKIYQSKFSSPPFPPKRLL